MELWVPTSGASGGVSDYLAPVPSRAFSSEPEPWRLLQSSLAVSFDSKRSKRWSPDAVPQATRADIVSALESWSATRLLYFRVQSLLFDIIWAAVARRNEGESGPARVAGSVAARCAQARDLASGKAELALGAPQLREALAWLETSAAELDLVTAGFVRVSEGRSGAVAIGFTFGKRRAELAPDQLRERGLALRAKLRWCQNAMSGAAGELARN